MTEQTIPVVDLRDFTAGTPADKHGFVDTVGGALRELGFFAVESHGVDAGLISEAYGVAKEFFGLDEGVRKSYELAGIRGQRGYTSFGREHARDQPAPDLKEFWHVGRELPETHPLFERYPRNVWPKELPHFRGVMTQLYRQLDACSMALLKACALYLDLPETTFSDMVRGGDTVLRVIHYPPVPEGAHPQSIRAAAHEDINLITLLCESTGAGLELLQKDGEWRAIHAQDGQIVADAGDMLQNVTNGVFKSTTHRVVNPSNSRHRRFSMPFFVHPRSEVDLTPHPDCVARAGGETRYPPTTAGKYLHQRLAEIGLA